MNIILRTFSAVILMSIVSCGGGGSGSPPANTVPTAVAPADFSTVEGSQVSLSGSGSGDSDGSISSYLWVQTAGSPTVTLTAENTVTASFAAPDVNSDTMLTFELTVTDNDGATATDSVVVVITVDQPPTAVAPADFDAIEATTVSLDGSASTDDVSVASYLWQQTAGNTVTLNNTTSAIASFVAPDVVSQPIPLTFQLTVTDSVGATATDSVTVSIIDTPPLVTLSGIITYDRVPPHTTQNGLDYNNIVQAPVRGATVDLLDGSGSPVLDTTVSDINGDYSFEVMSGNSYKVRVKAELLKTDFAPTWNFKVVDNTANKALYAMDSDAVTVTANTILNLNAASGWTGSAYTTPRVAAPFAILDDVFQAAGKILVVDSTVVMEPLKLNWSVNNVTVPGDTSLGNISTSHFNGTEIFILGAADSDTDEYDDHVIIHEWGHYFEAHFSRSDSIGGSHSGNDKLDPRVALGEGFGNALSGMVTDDPFYRDSLGVGQSQGFSINVELNPVTNKGWFSESSVQSILYDLYDSTDDGSDNLSLGFAPIYAALINGERTTEAFTTIFSLTTKIKDESPSNAVAIDALLASQSILVADDYGSTETNNGGDARNLPIYRNLLVDGSSVEICSFKINGYYNKLGNRQYLRFEIVTTGNYQFTAVGRSVGDDPDLYVFKQGELEFSSNANGNESTIQTLTPGQYAMDAHEFANVDPEPNTTRKDTCIDITLSSN